MAWKDGFVIEYTSSGDEPHAGRRSCNKCFFYDGYMQCRVLGNLEVRYGLNSWRFCDRYDEGDSPELRKKIQSKSGVSRSRKLGGSKAVSSGKTGVGNSSQQAKSKENEIPQYTIYKEKRMVEHVDYGVGRAYASGPEGLLVKYEGTPGLKIFSRNGFSEGRFRLLTKSESAPYEFRFNARVPYADIAFREGQVVDNVVHGIGRVVESSSQQVVVSFNGQELSFSYKGMRKASMWRHYQMK